MGAVDVLGGFDDYKSGTPGDYGWKLLTSSDPEEKTYKLQAELANGRLAMVAREGASGEKSKVSQVRTPQGLSLKNGGRGCARHVVAQH